MKIRLSCEFAKHGDRMRVICTKTGNLCAYQYYRQCKGWFELTDGAAGCLMRKGDEYGRETSEGDAVKPRNTRRKRSQSD